MSIAGLKALVSRTESLLLCVYIASFAVLWTETWPEAVIGLAIIPPLVWLSTSDLESYVLPDFATVAVALVGALHVVWQEPSLLEHVAAAALTFAILWGMGELYFRQTGEEGLGIGDAKLFGAGALLLGWEQLPELVLFASLGGLIATFLRRGRSLAEGIPFGPFIAYALYILFFLDPLFL